MAFTARKKIETQEVEIQDGYYRNQKKLYYVNGNELITVTEYPGIQTFGLLKEDISKDHSFPNEWEVISEDIFWNAFKIALAQFTSYTGEKWNEEEIYGCIVQWRMEDNREVLPTEMKEGIGYDLRYNSKSCGEYEESVEVDGEDETVPGYWKVKGFTM